KLPNRVSWLALTGVGCLAGIGFTMALFISSLALYPEQEIYSKTGILLGSLASTIVGAVILWISFCTSDKSENT
ncbi:MAG: Na+/H+ antiporter NhaA, partial [Oligoflexia bacterium]|nr:Na+/H+ antiporter NhaA [Oligoflexia bacterium]